MSTGAAAASQDAQQPDPSDGAQAPASPAPPPAPASPTNAAPVVVQPVPTTSSPPESTNAERPTQAGTAKTTRGARWFEVWRPSWWLTDLDGN